jgi:hypothetical protein
VGLCSSPRIPNPADAAVGGIRADVALQPQNYLINAAAQTGKKVTIGGRTYDFSGLGQTDVGAAVGDKMAAALLQLQKEKSPAIIQERLDELKAADPEGYAARKQLFDRIVADAQANPDRPVSSELQQQLQDELAKGVGFSDAKEAEQAREGARGGQVARGIYLGNAATGQEARTVVGAGETLRNKRQQNALALLESGASPEDVAYRRMQQSLGNLGSFVAGQTPEAQFREVSSAGNGPVPLVPGAPSTNTFNPNAAGQGLQNSLGIYQGQIDWANSQANPWLAGISTGLTAAGAYRQINGPTPPSVWGAGGAGGSGGGYSSTQFQP